MKIITAGTNGEVQGNTTSAINDAAFFVASHYGGGIVQLLDDNYDADGVYPIYSNVKIKGKRGGKSTITGSPASTYFFQNLLPNILVNAYFENLIFDHQNALNGGGIAIYYANNCKMKGCEFKNLNQSGWFLKLGVNDGSEGSDDEDYYCENNTIEDCIFDTHSGSLEQLVIFNAKNTTVSGCTFKNKVRTASNIGINPSLGIWQKVDGLTVKDCTFQDNDGSPIYYSITTKNIMIDRCNFSNNRSGVIGANVSDNGKFGEERAGKVVVKNCVFTGGAITTAGDGMAIQIGAVDGFELIKPSISGYPNPIVVNGGNSPASASAINFVIDTPVIIDNNPASGNSILKPAILFSNIGGSLNGKINYGEIRDDQTPKKMQIPICFYGAYNWEDIEIKGTELVATGGNQSIQLQDGATLASTVKYLKTPAIPSTYFTQGTLPAQNVAINQF